MQKFIASTTGIRLWTESFGKPDNPSVLLVMGAMNQGIFWPDEFCEGLVSAGFYVVRYDHRDTGQSSQVDFRVNPYELKTLTDDAVAIIHGYGLVQPTVVGLSMGGYIAQMLAAGYPDIARRLVLISTTADHRPYMAATRGQSTAGFSLPGPEQRYLDYIISAATNPPKTRNEMLRSMSDGWKVTYGGSRPYPKLRVEQTLQRAVQRAPDVAASFHHGLAVAASPDRLELVTRIATPTLVIHGRYDPLLPLAHGEHLASHMPNAKLEIFDMGHSFMWSWDTEILASVLGFIRAQ